MKVLTFLPGSELKRRVEKALNSSQFVVENVNVVDVYISALRNKIDRDFPQKSIQTNRGVGYTFTSASSCLADPNSRVGRSDHDTKVS